VLTEPDSTTSFGKLFQTTREIKLFLFQINENCGLEGLAVQ